MSLNKLIKFDSLIKKSYTNHHLIGIDEVGRGAFAGPVIACAFSWNKNTLPELSKVSSFLKRKLNDSKQLNPEEREKLSVELLKLGNYEIGYGSVCEIEKLNILNATFLAMKRAFEKLAIKLKSKKTYVLIDGNKFNPFINSSQISIVAGDEKSSLIASASIIAKVYRDNLMKKLSNIKDLKDYDWSTNAGYGTLSHREAIRKLGLTPFHRKLFVRKTLTVN